LYYCEELTGVFGLGWGMVDGVKIGSRLRPQSNTQRTFHDLSSLSDCRQHPNKIYSWTYLSQ
jgi:hypothetical protein